MTEIKGFNIGDKVSVINDTLKGTISSIDNKLITIVCEDGFEYEYHNKELVVIKDWNDLLKQPLKKIKSEPSISNLSKPKIRRGKSFEVVDLHIHELIDKESGMSSHDKLSLQLRSAKRELEAALAKQHAKIVFIHGRGAGVLKKELRKMLSNYEVDFHDASYLEFGQGATEVLLYQNKK